MARTEKTVIKATRTNTPPASAKITTTTIDSTLVTNGLSITDFFNVEEPRLHVYNSAAGAKKITLVASTEATAIKGGIGNFTLSIPAGETHVLDQVESARFMQAGGALHVDFATGFTGTIVAVGTSKGIV